MKRLLIAVLCAALALSLAACSGRGGRQAGGGDRQGQRADVTGEVSAVNGTSITVKVMAFGNGPRGSGAPGGMRSRNPNATRNPNFTRDPNATRPANMPALTRQYTGEEKTLAIPADAKITSTVLDNGSPQQVVLQLSDVKVGDIVAITYKSDQKTVDTVRVMSDFGGGQAPGQTNG